MSFIVNGPYEVFNDLKGDPLEDGKIYIGTVLLNPEINPINVFFDAALSIPAAQPIRTIGGYPSQNGTPGNIYIAENSHSITLRDKNDKFIYSDLGAVVVESSVLFYDVISDMTALLKSSLMDNQQVNIAGYNVVGDGGGDSFYWDENSVETADGGFIFESNEGGTGRWKRINNSGKINILAFGVVGDRITDDTVAVENSAAYMNANVGILDIPLGVEALVFNSIYFTSSIIFIGGGKIVGDESGVYADAVVNITGAITQIENLGVNASRFDRSVELASTPSLSENDTFIIYNPTDFSFNGARAEYRAGEFCRVRKIAANVVTLFNGLYDGYLLGDVDIYRMDELNVNIGNLSVVAPTTGSVVGVTVDLATSVIIDGAKTFGSSFSNITIRRSTNINYTSSESIVNADSAGLQYGITISCCQNLSGSANFLYSVRHGFNLGNTNLVGGVPNRNFRLYGMHVFNSDGGNTATGAHGGLEDISYSNCTLHGGAAIGGKNMNYYNCKIWNITNSGVSVLGSELIGGTFNFIGCTFITNIEPVGRGLIYAALDTNTTEDFTLNVLGCDFEGGVMTGEAFVRVDQEGTVKVNVKIGGETSVKSTAVASSFLRISEIGAGVADSDFIIVDGVQGDPSNYLFPDGAFSILSVLKLQSQTIMWQDASALSTNIIFAGAAIPFHTNYPVVPQVMGMGIRGRSGANLATVGGRPPNLATWDLNSNNITPAMQTADKVNFTSVQDFDAFYTVGINDL